MEIKSWEDVFKAVSKECKADDELPDFNEEDIKFVHNFLWQTVGYYLRNPLEARQGILIGGLFHFYFRTTYIQKIIDSAERRGTSDAQLYQTYKQIIKQANGKE